jgi:hypothetical protein
VLYIATTPQRYNKETTMSLATLSTTALLANAQTTSKRPDSNLMLVPGSQDASNDQTQRRRPYQLMGSYLPGETVYYGARRARLVRRGYA